MHSVSETKSESDEQVEPERRQSDRIKLPHIRYGINAYADTATVSVQRVAYDIHQFIEPQTMSEAQAGDFSNEWKQAKDSKYYLLLLNEHGILWSCQVERKL